MPLVGDNSAYKGKALPILTAHLPVEMECFDRLGPKARAALNACTFKFTAALWIKWCGDRGLDPRHPDVDAQIAATVYRDEKVGIESDPQCA